MWVVAKEMCCGGVPVLGEDDVGEFLARELMSGDDGVAFGDG